MERLHLSESAAGKRTTAARTARRFPMVLDMIASTEVHVSAVNMLAAHLTEQNHAELLGRARHRSKREVEKLVAEIAPRPDVTSRVVALPQQSVAAPVVEQTVASSSAPAIERLPSSAPARVHAPGRAAARVAPLSPRRYQIRITVDEETHPTLFQLQDLLSHQVPDRDHAVIISRALDLLHERTLARKAAATKGPRAGKPPAKRTRNIPTRRCSTMAPNSSPHGAGTGRRGWRSLVAGGWRERPWGYARIRGRATRAST